MSNHHDGVMPCCLGDEVLVDELAKGPGSGNRVSELTDIRPDPIRLLLQDVS